MVEGVALGSALGLSSAFIVSLSSSVVLISKAFETSFPKEISPIQSRNAFPPNIELKMAPGSTSSFIESVRAREGE